jgi:cytochrome P450
MEFDPDRFLVPLDRAQNDAYMPFSKGPLNCIGRQLALTEAQVVMVLTLRFFDFEPVYGEDAPTIPGWGGKAYQELKLGAKAKDGIPMRVRLRESGGES